MEGIAHAGRNSRRVREPSESRVVEQPHLLRPRAGLNRTGLAKLTRAPDADLLGRKIESAHPSIATVRGRCLRSSVRNAEATAPEKRLSRSTAGIASPSARGRCPEATSQP